MTTTQDSPPRPCPHTGPSGVAIVGTGTIGASWATHHLAHSFDVVATDPAPGAQKAPRSYVDAAWDAVTTLGLPREPRRIA